MSRLDPAELRRLLETTDVPRQSWRAEAWHEVRVYLGQHAEEIADALEERQRLREALRTVVECDGDLAADELEPIRNLLEGPNVWPSDNRA